MGFWNREARWAEQSSAALWLEERKGRPLRRAAATTSCLIATGEDEDLREHVAADGRHRHLNPAVSETAATGTHRNVRGGGLD
jgi:hypothetical protein